jgi:hypothetical protein
MNRTATSVRDCECNGSTSQKRQGPKGCELEYGWVTVGIRRGEGRGRTRRLLVGQHETGAESEETGQAESGVDAESIFRRIGSLCAVSVRARVPAVRIPHLRINAGYRSSTFPNPPHAAMPTCDPSHPPSFLIPQKTSESTLDPL